MKDRVPPELARGVAKYTGHNWWNAYAALGFKFGSKINWKSRFPHLADLERPPSHLIQQLQNYTNMPFWVSHPDAIAAVKRGTFK